MCIMQPLKDSCELVALGTDRPDNIYHEKARLSTHIIIFPVQNCTLGDKYFTQP